MDLVRNLFYFKETVFVDLTRVIESGAWRTCFPQENGFGSLEVCRRVDRVINTHLYLCKTQLSASPSVTA